MLMLIYMKALWRSMKVLIDTNVIIDFLLKREPFYQYSKMALLKCTKESVEGYIAMHTVSNLWYVLRKESDENRRKCLRIICLLLKVCFTNHNEVYNSIKNTDFKDFEDCLQESCAYVNKLDYIITRNKKDYNNSRISALLPKEFIEL